MDVRHKNQLIGRLEECVVTQGWCTIRDEELRLWYGKKITKLVWQDILEKLKEVCDANELSFESFEFCTYRHDGNILIVDGGELQSLDGGGQE